jgi:GAF domain-containing protein
MDAEVGAGGSGGMSGTIDWAVELLADADSVEEIETILRNSARAGVDAQGATVIRLDGGHCYYADEDAMSPLWKGQRFPLRRCISGWSMLHRQTVVIPDTSIDSRIPQEAYRPTFVRSLLVVPIGTEAPVGAIGVYWADFHRASREEITLIERLAGAAGSALARVRRNSRVRHPLAGVLPQPSG